MPRRLVLLLPSHLLRLVRYLHDVDRNNRLIHPVLHVLQLLQLFVGLAYLFALFCLGDERLGLSVAGLEFVFGNSIAVGAGYWFGINGGLVHCFGSYTLMELFFPFLHLRNLRSSLCKLCSLCHIRTYSSNSRCIRVILRKIRLNTIEALLGNNFFGIATLPLDLLLLGAVDVGIGVDVLVLVLREDLLVD